MPMPPASYENCKKKMTIKMNKIFAFIILNLSGYCALAMGLPKAEILWQHFFPFDNISFSYKKESATKGEKIEKNYFLIFDRLNRSYKLVSRKDNLELSYSNNKITSLQDRKYGVIKNDFGIMDFPSVLNAWVDPYADYNLRFSVQDTKKLKLYEDGNYIVINHANTKIYFTKNDYQLAIVEEYIEDRTADNNEPYSYLFKKYTFNKFYNLNGTNFPLSIKEEIYGADGNIVVTNDYTIDEKSIRINDNFNSSTAISFPEGTIVWNMITNARYIHTGIDGSTTKEEAIERLLDDAMKSPNKHEDENKLIKDK